MIAVNCTAMTEMCAIVLPKMIARNRGVVMNISSASARGMLIHPTYSATKAFVSVLSDCLNRTYSGKGTGKVKKNFEVKYGVTKSLFTLVLPYWILSFKNGR